jgi:hypothetical protein
MKIQIVQARFLANTFGGPDGVIAFDFNDVQTMFHLGEIEMNQVRTWVPVRPCPLDII